MAPTDVYVGVMLITFACFREAWIKLELNKVSFAMQSKGCSVKFVFQ